MGFVNFNCLYILSRYLIDVNIPCVIQADFLCLYLLNFTNLFGICLVLARFTKQNTKQKVYKHVMFIKQKQNIYMKKVMFTKQN